MSDLLKYCDILYLTKIVRLWMYFGIAYRSRVESKSLFRPVSGLVRGMTNTPPLVEATIPEGGCFICMLMICSISPQCVSQTDGEDSQTRFPATLRSLFPTARKCMYTMDACFESYKQVLTCCITCFMLWGALILGMEREIMLYRVCSRVPRRTRTMGSCHEFKVFSRVTSRHTFSFLSTTWFDPILWVSSRRMSRDTFGILLCDLLQEWSVGINSYTRSFKGLRDGMFWLFLVSFAA